MAIPQLKRGGKQSAEGLSIPSSMQGINSVTSLALMNAAECVYTYNLVAQDLGMVVRRGFEEWAKGWTGGIAKTVIPFEGHQTSHDKLFVANNEGIWDCTAEGEIAPTKVLTWSTQTGEAGYCSQQVFTNDGNDMFILLCDAVNGYHVYTQTTNTWAKVTLGTGAGQVSGIDPTNFNFVMIWKNRVWFIEKDSANSWYLDVATLYGAATKFNFGAQFRQGGSLRTLYNWSLDGGLGLDDLLVAVSSSGDVVVYQGTDPDDATKFAIQGSWEIGSVPAGNRFGTEFGGEVYILSIYGLLPISQLLNGSSTNDPNTYLTAKISPFIRQVMSEFRENLGWQVVVHPEDAQLHIETPQDPQRGNVAFVQYFGNQAWSMIRELDKFHTANWRGNTFWTAGNKNSLQIKRGNRENVWIDPGTDGVASPIEWSILTSFQGLGSGARNKRVQYIRPNFIADSVPGFSVSARYDYDIREQGSAPAGSLNEAGRWDLGIWDQDVWGGSLDVLDSPRGASGIGRHVAVAMRGRSTARTILIAFDLIVDSGGWM